jgi:hypothetical protein
MGFTSFFSGAWEGATKTAKAAAAKVADMTVESIDQIQAGYKATKDEIIQGAKYIKDETIKAKNYTVEQIQSGYEIAKEEIKKDINYIKNKAVQAKNYTVEKIKKVYEKAKAIALSIKNFITTTCPLYIKKVTDIFYHNNIDQSWDGKFLSCSNCNSDDNCGINPAGPAPQENNLPSTGKKPKAKCNKNPLPKVYFVNGINNTPKENCEAAKAIANASCVEVFSIYNRTQGMVTDIFECLGNVFNSHPFGGDKPTQAIKNVILNSINKEPPETVTVYAHSQGGLITREALGEVKKELKGIAADDEIEAKMNKINIKSFGTAKNYWPKGPVYEQFSHPNDPVSNMAIPMVDGVKDAFLQPSPMYGDVPNPDYEAELQEYNSQFAEIPENQRHIVNTKDDKNNELKGIASHSMVNSYVPGIKMFRRKEDKCDICQV